MSKRLSLQSILEKAEKKERKYLWLEASKLYEQALSVIEETSFLKKGEIQEQIAHCFYKAAFQADTQEEFKKRMGLSVEAYEEAARLSEKLGGSTKHARTSFYNAIAAYCKSWVAEGPSQRKMLLDVCRKLLKEALKAYDEAGDQLGYGKACNELSVCLEDRYWFAWDWKECKNILEEAIKDGEKAVEVLLRVGNEYELARAYQKLSLHLYATMSFYESVEKQSQLMRESYAHAQKALELSEKTGDSYLVGMSNHAIGYVVLDLKGDVESSIKHAEKTLETGTMTKDNLVTAIACEFLAYYGGWKMNLEEDPDMRRNGLNKAIQYAEDAATHYQLISFPYATVNMQLLECYFSLAGDATKLDDKRLLLERAAEGGRRGLEKAERSGSQLARHYVLHSLSKVLYSLSIMETKAGDKRKLLEEAAKHRKESIDLAEQLEPFYYWNKGVLLNYLALLKAELANIATAHQEKKELLEEAVKSMKSSLRLCQREIKARPQQRLLSVIGDYQNWFGGILNQLYMLTGEKGHLKEAIGVYGDAIQAWEKADLHGRVAEGHWQTANLYDHLTEHSKAAGEFKSASEKYTLAAEKVPQLKAFYVEHAVYMQAWSEIEKAKRYHADKQYGQARKHYEAASDLHKSTKRWKYLHANYSAWARLEAAEDQSRRNQTEEARDLFLEGGEMFVQAAESIKAKLGEIETDEEKKVASQLAKASDTRREYCFGRCALEEGKLLDRKGEHVRSSKKYGLAAETFRKIAETEPEQSRAELLPIVYLSQAWQEMMMAEAKASSSMYGKAAELFRLAQEHTFDERTSLLALANSCFCKALQAGTEFETTRDVSAYSLAKNHMEAAATYYVKAGLKNASEYAKATHRLFDAYTYMHKAAMETKPEKKAQFYRMTEKLLQASVNSFDKTKHTEKSRQVERLLETVKEEQQLAMSLVEVLRPPAATLATTSFSMPNPTYEQAVGLEIFEHAQIQANLIGPKGDVNVGEDVVLEIEMINAGKGAATLVKIEDLIPTAMFKVVDKPEMYRFEDSYLNMKGKRLDPLKTEEVKIVAKPQAKGTFTMKPRILYIDEMDKYRSHEPEPVTINVRELGIKGWIKGER